MSDKKESTKKKVLSTKKYTITVQTFEDGTQNIRRVNEGFQSLELLGLADFIAMEVREQIVGRFAPDVIQREVLV